MGRQNQINEFIYSSFGAYVSWPNTSLASFIAETQSKGSKDADTLGLTNSSKTRNCGFY